MAAQKWGVWTLSLEKKKTVLNKVLPPKLISNTPSRFHGYVRKELAYSFGSLVVFGTQKVTMRLGMDGLWGLFCFINNNEPFPTLSYKIKKKKSVPRV